MNHLVLISLKESFDTYAPVIVATSLQSKPDGSGKPAAENPFTIYLPYHRRGLAADSRTTGAYEILALLFKKIASSYLLARTRNTFNFPISK